MTIEADIVYIHSNSKFNFQFQIPNSNSKFEFQISNLMLKKCQICSATSDTKLQQFLCKTFFPCILNGLLSRKKLEETNKNMIFNFPTIFKEHFNA